MCKIKFFLSFLFVSTLLTAQVGIGTITPQAQLDVEGGNVRFSDYGTGTQTGTEVYLLGVEADGDVVELPLENSVTGLQYYMWDTANVTQPNINNVRTLGIATSYDSWTGDLDNAARATIAPTVSEGYIIRFVGTIKVQNTGRFAFNASSDDGSRVYVDNVLVVENWFDQGTATRSGNVTLAEGEHRIEFWYYENSGGDSMEFTWGANPDGYTVGSVINASSLYVK